MLGMMYEEMVYAVAGHVQLIQHVYFVVIHCISDCDLVCCVVCCNH